MPSKDINTIYPGIIGQYLSSCLIIFYLFTRRQPHSHNKTTFYLRNIYSRV